MDLLERIRSRRAHVAVVGLGYVGLPLSLRAAAAGFSVTGIDLDQELVARLAAGSSPLSDVPDEDVQTQLRSGHFVASTDVEALAESDVITICVPTPLKDDLPDMSFIQTAAKDAARFLRPGQLVILESTTYPGTTEELVSQILESSGLSAGEDFFLGFSPERIDPGNPTYGLGNVPKIIGGIDSRSANLMEAFYGAFVDKVVRMSSPKAAEMVKLLENTYRHVNIALANEMAILCHDLGIDVWEVINAAATKPFGFQPFYPGPGWGGHCIPVDPAFLSWRVRQMGETARFVELAREINDRMPAYVVQRIVDCLNDEGKSLRDSSLLILGVTYKADVPDVRESPALDIFSRLVKGGARVSFHDPYVGELSIGDESVTRQELTEKALQDADVVVVIAAHSNYEWAWIADNAKLIFDTRNALEGHSGRIIRL